MAKAQRKKQQPVILVTNDDGITAPGIRALVAAMSALGEVVVVAPDSPQSGMGHAITIGEPLRLYETHIFEGVVEYECFYIDAGANQILSQVRADEAVGAGHKYALAA